MASRKLRAVMSISEVADGDETAYASSMAKKYLGEVTRLVEGLS